MKGEEEMVAQSAADEMVHPFGKYLRPFLMRSEKDGQGISNLSVVVAVVLFTFDGESSEGKLRMFGPEAFCAKIVRVDIFCAQKLFVGECFRANHSAGMFTSQLSEGFSYIAL